MRTTVDLEDDVLDALRSLARARGRSLGTVISDIVRRSVAPVPHLGEGPGGFPAFALSRAASPLTVEAVRAASDDDA